MTVFWLGELNV